MISTRDYNLKNIEKYKSGERLSASKMNRTVDVLRRSNNGVAFPRQINRLSLGTTAEESTPDETGLILRSYFGILSKYIRASVTDSNTGITDVVWQEANIQTTTIPVTVVRYLGQRNGLGVPGQWGVSDWPSYLEEHPNVTNITQELRNSMPTIQAGALPGTILSDYGVLVDNREYRRNTVLPQSSASRIVKVHIMTTNNAGWKYPHFADLPRIS